MVDRTNSDDKKDINKSQNSSFSFKKNILQTFKAKPSDRDIWSPTTAATTATPSCGSTASYPPHVMMNDNKEMRHSVNNARGDSRLRGHPSNIRGFNKQDSDHSEPNRYSRSKVPSDTKMNTSGNHSHLEKNDKVSATISSDQQRRQLHTTASRGIQKYKNEEERISFERPQDVHFSKEDNMRHDGPITLPFLEAMDIEFDDMGSIDMRSPVVRIIDGEKIESRPPSINVIEQRTRRSTEPIESNLFESMSSFFNGLVGCNMATGCQTIKPTFDNDELDFEKKSDDSKILSRNESIISDGASVVSFTQVYVDEAIRDVLKQKQENYDQEIKRNVIKQKKENYNQKHIDVLPQKQETKDQEIIPFVLEQKQENHDQKRNDILPKKQEKHDNDQVRNVVEQKKGNYDQFVPQSIQPSTTLVHRYSIISSNSIISGSSIIISPIDDVDSSEYEDDKDNKIRGTSVLQKSQHVKNSKICRIESNENYSGANEDYSGAYHPLNPVPGLDDLSQTSSSVDAYHESVSPKFGGRLSLAEAFSRQPTRGRNEFSSESVTRPLRINAANVATQNDNLNTSLHPSRAGNRIAELSGLLSPERKRISQVSDVTASDVSVQSSRRRDKLKKLPGGKSMTKLIDKVEDLFTPKRSINSNISMSASVSQFQATQSITRSRPTVVSQTTVGRSVSLPRPSWRDQCRRETLVGSAVPEAFSAMNTEIEEMSLVPCYAPAPSTKKRDLKLFQLRPNLGKSPKRKGSTDVASVATASRADPISVQLDQQFRNDRDSEQERPFINIKSAETNDLVPRRKSAALEEISRSCRSAKQENIFGNQDQKLQLFAEELGWYILSCEDKVVRELRAYIPHCIRSTNLEDRQTLIKTMHGAVVFADVSGFTALTETLAKNSNGAETLSACLNEFFTPLIDIIESYHGDIIKFSGDALTIVFEGDIGNKDGREDTHKDNYEKEYRNAALRAAACSIEIQEKLHNFDVAGIQNLYNSKNRVDYLRLALHIAVAVGPIGLLQVGGMFQRFEFIIVGDPLRQIAVGADLAANGETALSPDAWAAVGDTFKKVPITLDKEYPPGYALLGACNKGDLQAIRNGTLENNMTSPDYNYEWATRIDRLKRFLPRSVVAHYEAGTAANVNETRNVSVLFCTIANLEPPGLKDNGIQVMQDLMYAMQEACYGMEGNVNKFLVDDKGVLFVVAFGLPPLVHTDDPLRAVMCCLNMATALSKMGLSGHFGIATGRVFAGIVGSKSRREDTVMGDTVNLSARLMSKSEPNGILVCSVTHKRIKNYMFCQELAPLKLKGKSKLIQCYRPESPMADVPYLRANLSYKIRSRFTKKLTDANNIKTDCTLPWRPLSNNFGGPSLLPLVSDQQRLEKIDQLFHNNQSNTCFMLGPTGSGKVEAGEEMVFKSASAGWATAFSVTYCLTGEKFRPLWFLIDSLVLIIKNDHHGISLNQLVELYPEHIPILRYFRYLRKDEDDNDSRCERKLKKGRDVINAGLMLVKCLVNKIIMKQPLLITLRESLGPTLFLAPTTEFWNVATFLILECVQSRKKSNYPILVTIIARKVPNYCAPQIYDKIDKERYCVDFGPLSLEASDELLWLSLQRKNRRKGRIFEYEPKRLPASLIQFIRFVAINNPCYIQETVNKLIEEGHVDVEDNGNIIQVTRNLEEIEIQNWVDTHMVGGTLARIEKLSPKCQQVLKIAAVFDGPISSLDINSANLMIFTRGKDNDGNDFVTLFDLVKSIMACQTLIDRGILELFEFDKNAPCVDFAPRETLRFTISNFLLKKIIGSMVLARQRKLIRRCVLIGRACALGCLMNRKHTRRFRRGTSQKSPGISYKKLHFFHGKEDKEKSIREKRRLAPKKVHSFYRPNNSNPEKSAELIQSLKDQLLK